MALELFSRLGEAIRLHQQIRANAVKQMIASEGGVRSIRGSTQSV